MAAKGWGFVGIICAAAVPPLAIAAQLESMPGANALNFGGALADAIVRIAPSVVADAALVGIATPVAAAGALAFLAPSKENNAVFSLAIFVTVVTWLAYLWLAAVLGSPDSLQMMSNILSGDGDATYVVNFATAGKLLFLSLAATLVGVKLRPKPAIAAIALGLLAFSSPGDASAGEIRVAAGSDAFTVKASLRTDASDQTASVASSDGAFVFPFDETLFATNAYVDRILTIEWTPKPESALAAKGVKAFAVDVPILLRRWRSAEVYSIEARPMAGTNEQALRALEPSALPAKPWTRYLASLQQAEHLARAVSADFGRTKRALNTAVDAMSSIARAGWALPPADLRDRLSRSFKDDDAAKLASLNEAFDNAESNIWKDLRTIVRDLKGQSCPVVGATFDYLAGRKAANERAYTLQLRVEPDALEARRLAALKDCQADATAPPPTSAAAQ